MKTTINQLIILSLFLFLSTQGNTQTYIPYDSCFNMSQTEIYCMAIVNDTLLVSGAGMDTAGGIYTNHIALWDGQHFHAMGLGNTNMENARDAIYYNDTTYIVGSFGSMGNVPYTHVIAAWHNQQYYSIAQITGLATLYSVAVWHDTLFFGGDGASVNGTVYNNNIFARHNEQFFSVGGLAEKAWDLEVYNDKLYAVAWSYLYEYDPTINDFNIVAYFDGTPFCMTVDTINNFLYVGGPIHWAMGVYTDGVARWNGFNWENIGDGSKQFGTWDIELYRGDIYIGPYDSLLGDLVRWDGQQWHMVGPYPGLRNAVVEKMKVYKDTLYVGCSDPTPTIGNDTVNGLFRLYMPPDTTCHWLMPRVLAHADTFYLPQGGGTVNVPLYNNNGYADSWSWDFDDGTTDTVKDPIHTYSQTGTYHVSVTVTEDGCTKTAEKDIVVMESTGIPALSLQDITFKIYPNPTKHDFTVEIMLPETVKEKTKFFVTGMNGVVKYQRQLQAGFNRFVVGTGGWHPATYICNLMAGGKFLGSKKLVLNK